MLPGKMLEDVPPAVDGADALVGVNVDVAAAFTGSVVVAEEL